MVIEQQISARRERARGTIVRILTRPDGNLYGDYSVRSASNKTYRVAMRGPGLFDNYCSCPDFAVNTLGTCKHIEALLLRLRRRRGEALDREVFNRARASLSLHYGDTLNVRLRLPLSPSTPLQALAREYFDDLGLLKSSRLRDFGMLMDELRKADDHAVIYSDVLNYVDRENEIAEGLEAEKELLAKYGRGRDPLAGLLKTSLLTYQVRGAIFTACRGRVILADDMGLGKTVQALAATELLRRRRGIQRVLVVAPASVKYQWKKEIEKFTRPGRAGHRGRATSTAGAVRFSEVFQSHQLRTGSQGYQVPARTPTGPRHPGRSSAHPELDDGHSPDRQAIEKPPCLRADRYPAGGQIGRAFFCSRICRRASVGPRLPLPPGTPDGRRGREVAGVSRP
jgi:hypothetical protein